jgi:hypothetical protein
MHLQLTRAEFVQRRVRIVAFLAQDGWFDGGLGGFRGFGDHLFKGSFFFGRRAR